MPPPTRGDRPLAQLSLPLEAPYRPPKAPLPPPVHAFNRLCGPLPFWAHGFFGLDLFKVGCLTVLVPFYSRGAPSVYVRAVSLGRPALFFSRQFFLSAVSPPPALARTWIHVPPLPPFCGVASVFLPPSAVRRVSELLWEVFFFHAWAMFFCALRSLSSSGSLGASSVPWFSTTVAPFFRSYLPPCVQVSYQPGICMPPFFSLLFFLTRFPVW